MSVDRQFKADPQFASKSQERRYKAQVKAADRPAPPPLMPSAERRRILFAPIIITRWGSAGATWSGVIVNDDPTLSRMSRRSKEERVHRLEKEYE